MFRELPIDQAQLDRRLGVGVFSVSIVIMINRDHRDHHQFHEHSIPLWWNRKFSNLSRHATHNKSSDGVQIIMIMLMIIVIIINFMKISYPYGGTVNFQVRLDMQLTQIIMIMPMIIVIIINFMKISYPYGGTIKFHTQTCVHNVHIITGSNEPRFTKPL